MITSKYKLLIFSFLGVSVACAQSNSAQNSYAEKVLQRYTESVAEYSALPNTFDGRLLGSDEALELSPEYLENPALAEILRTSAQEFINRIYEERLAAPAQPNERVIFSGGGTGSGKTSNLRMLEPLIRDQIPIIYDTTMSNDYYSTLFIDQVLASGRITTIIYVYRDPLDAFINGVIPRAQKTGRTVGCPYHVASHINSRLVMDSLLKRYANEPRFSLIVVDGSRGPEDRRIVPLHFIPYKDKHVLSREVNQAIERARLNKALDDKTLASTPICQ